MLHTGGRVVSSVLSSTLRNNTINRALHAGRSHSLGQSTRLESRGVPVSTLYNHLLQQSVRHHSVMPTRGLRDQAPATFERPRILAGGTGDVASRLVRYALEHPEADVYIMQQKGSKPPLNMPLNNVKILWVNPDEGNIYTEPERIGRIVRDHGITDFFPGWGNLSENRQALDTIQGYFRDTGRLIAPNLDFIDNVGHKGKARELAIQSHVPVVPGPEGLVTKENFAEKMAYFKPGEKVMFKAPLTGGGYGMRAAIVGKDDMKMFKEACAEGKCDALVVEKFVTRPFRHYESQTFGLQTSALSKPETFALRVSRNCSPQYKNAKWVQFSDPHDLPEELSLKLAAFSERIGGNAGQRGPATHEYLVIVEDDTRENMALLMSEYRVTEDDIVRVDGKLYLPLYNETNPRLQVEHPVTEMAYNELDIMHLSRQLSDFHQTFEHDSDLLGYLTELVHRPFYDIRSSMQVRIYALDKFQYEQDSGLSINIGASTQSSISGFTPVPSVYIDGTVGPPPTGQDQLFGRVNAFGSSLEDVTAKVVRSLQDLYTGEVQTNKGLVLTILEDDFPSWTVQTMSDQFKNPGFVNDAQRKYSPENIHSALKALALVHEHGLSYLRPGAKHPPLKVVPELPTIQFDEPVIENHYGHVMLKMVGQNPDMDLVDVRKMAAKEIVRRIRSNHNPETNFVAFIDTRLRDFLQSLMQNIQAQELNRPIREYHQRQRYLSIEATMGGNDQSRRGGESRSENEQFNRYRTPEHIEAGLGRGEIQVKLGDQKASVEERNDYIKDKERGFGPMLTELFTPFHSVDDWANEAQLWADRGHILVLYGPEHAHEMSGQQLWEDFFKPCLQEAEARGFIDQIAFVALKDTGSATKVSRVRSELSQLPTLAKQDGYGYLPWGFHTHDLGQGVHVSAELTDVGFRVHWVSPDCSAGRGANVPECALHDALKDLGYEVDFDTDLAQKMAPYDMYTLDLGVPYDPKHGLVSTTIIDNYLATGALAHTVKDLRDSFPDAKPEEQVAIFKQFSEKNRTMFLEVLRVPPLTPHPNKISKIVIFLMTKAVEKKIDLNELSKSDFITFCKDNMSPELAKYLSGHYPEWPQEARVKAEFPDLVLRAEQVYRDLKLTSEGQSWDVKKENTKQTLLNAGVHYDDSVVVDSSYHGTDMLVKLSEKGLTPESMYWLREADLQRMSHGGQFTGDDETVCPGKKGELIPYGMGAIPYEFLGAYPNGSEVEYVAQINGPSGQIIKVGVPAREGAGGAVDAKVYGDQPDGYYVSKSKEGEVKEWLLSGGIVFPGEDLALIEENKSTKPITATKVAVLTPLAAVAADGKKQVLKAGEKALDFSATGLTKEVEDALLALHELRSCESSEARAFRTLSVNAVAEAVSHYPVREVTQSSKDALLEFLSQEIGDHKHYDAVRGMFEKQLHVDRH